MPGVADVVEVFVPAEAEKPAAFDVTTVPHPFPLPPALSTAEKQKQKRQEKKAKDGQRKDAQRKRSDSGRGID